MLPGRLFIAAAGSSITGSVLIHVGVMEDFLFGFGTGEDVVGAGVGID